MSLVNHTAHPDKNSNPSDSRLYGLTFAILGFISVAAGAFGAHAMKDKLTTADLEVWKTATQYLQFHVATGLFCWAQVSKNQTTAAAWSLVCRMFAIGSVVFAGSLYLLAATQIKWLGAVTPLGGVLLLVGWARMFKTIALNTKQEIQ